MSAQTSLTIRENAALGIRQLIDFCSLAIYPKTFVADFLTALFLRLCATVKGLGRGSGPFLDYFFFFFIESGMNLLVGGFYELLFFALSIFNLNLAILLTIKVKI